MFTVTIVFQNTSESQTFADEAAARIYAGNLADMFNAIEFWKQNNSFIVDASHLEIVK